MTPALRRDLHPASPCLCCLVLALLVPPSGRLGSATAAAAATGCIGTGSVSAEDWEAAAAALSDVAVFGGRLPSKAAWQEWGRAWLPLGRRVREELEANLAACPEGSVAALLHSLSALDAEEGDAASLELIKMLYHLLGSGDAPLYSQSHAAGADWQQSWLLAASSLLRFAYLKWVNVPQDDVAQNVSLAAGMPGLQTHHAFLFKQTVNDFVRSGVYDLEMTENSVLFSEAFAFAAFCRLHEVDLVLESGVYKGVSTEIWSLFAKDVAAVDIFIPPEAEVRLARRSSVKLMTGDGRVVLPRLLEEQPKRRTAIFIDGPKGELAIRLALSLREYPQVAFVAMHDMAPYRQELIKLGAFFFSDETWFQDAYGHLDAPFRLRPDLPAGGTMAFLSSAAAPGR